MYYFIYPSKDAYIYELNTNSEKNFGGDNNLVLKKEFDGTVLKGVSRVLLHFDLTELSNSIASNEITTSLDGNGVSPKYFLRLYEQKTSELSPAYSLATFPLSSSWEDGTGYTTQDPNNRNGVSWERTNESFDNTKWVKTASGFSGSRNIPGGGVWITGSGYYASQSFSYQSPDVNMDITDMVNNWITGSTANNYVENYGLILKWSGSQEDSSTETGHINFFSSNANSIYSPKIEVRWDEHTNDYGGTIQDYEEEFGDGTGTFDYPDVPSNPITIDGTDDNYMFMIGLRKTYKETEKPRFRVAARERYQPKTVSTSKTASKNKLVPQGSGSYSIVDVETGTTLIPFGDYSILSTDTLSNFFKLKLNSFINNRLYRVLLRLKTDDNKLLIFDDGWDFKVVN